MTIEEQIVPLIAEKLGVNPSEVTMGTEGSQTFARWRSGDSSVIIGDNCYYSQIPATAQAHVGMTWLLGYEP